MTLPSTIRKQEIFACAAAQLSNCTGIAFSCIIANVVCTVRLARCTYVRTFWNRGLFFFFNNIDISAGRW